MEPKVHNSIRRCPPPVPILRQITPVHTPHPTSWRSILILSSHIRLGLPSGLLPSGFPAKILIANPHPTRATCPSTPHPTLLDLITRILFGWGIQIIKLLIMQFSPFPCYLVHFRSKYSPQHPIFKDLQQHTIMYNIIQYNINNNFLQKSFWWEPRCSIRIERRTRRS